MRRYDDLVEVRKGPVTGSGGDAHDEGPQQFLWRGKLWQVREVVAHWVETGSWWAARDPRSETEVWRVTAARGRMAALAALAGETAAGGPAEDDPGFGVFDLTFDWGRGDWRLVRSVD